MLKNFRLFLLVMCLLPALPATFARAAPSPCSLEDLDWFLGNWSLGDGKSRTIERWQRSGPDSFTGLGRTTDLATGQISFQENILLRQQPDGIFYIVMASQNEEPVSFRLTACGEKEAVFENPDHDFPTRIHYRLIDGALRADVRGPDGEGFEITFGRDK
ncbi:DUF6265 family protein [Emcibacter sp.]|uniref:DUF6265 family protein n=1 Tax=Emcibacter sp. TaxID=1979954 RepID=UPI002AA66AB1|nr:DUF6265 family protein [Emcibacter sp.]